ncbi:MAG: serine--tRNA ligase, partial [Cyclobacteriaceae bacterium]|nr:serine--tRNA ligase [Cyclobacteriaceae bacterium]
MLRIADIKEDLEKVVKGLEKKRVENASQQIDHLLKLDENRRNTQAELDAILNELKNISKQIGALMQTGDREGAEKAKVQTGEMKSKSKLLQEQLKSSEEQLMQALYNLPNRAHERVPVGNSAEDNEVILEKGEIPILSNDAQPHWELIEKYDIIDFSLGNKISGAGFPVYKGKGAKL